jgi:hypothetical protein
MQTQKGLLALALLAPLGALAQTQEFSLTIKNHRFVPRELTVPAGKRLKLVIDNQDPTPEEFESRALRLEKVIPGHGKGSVNVGPLKPGRYGFVGEFHESTAKGALLAE